MKQQSSSVMLGQQTNTALKLERRNFRLDPIENPRIPTQNNPQQKSFQMPKVIKSRKKVKKGYEIASYQRAEEYLNTQMYRKIIDSDGQKNYQPYHICDQNTQLRQYGLGVYLYLEFMRRLLITLFIMSIIYCLSMYYCYNDVGLADYPSSFMHTLSLFTLGNLKEADQRAYLTVSICDALSTLIFFIFYLHFRSFYNETVDQYDKDYSIVNPTTYALAVTGFNKQTDHLQQNLKAHYDSLYRGAYEVEVVYDYDRNFHLFMELDEIIQKIEKQRQVITQTGKSNDQLVEFQKELQAKEQQILHISKDFDPLYAIIHFKTLRSKYAYINFCKRYGLLNNTSSALKRFFCCIPQPPQKDRFRRTDILMVQKSTLNRPQQINWNNLDISFCNKLFRVIFAFIFLVVIVFLTSSAIGLCTLYAASTSNCVNFNSAMTLAEATTSTDQTTMYCYCSQNYAYTGGNSAQLQAACQGLSQKIFITNIVQLAASAASAVTNLILIIAIQLIAEYLIKPQTKSGQYLFVFVLILLTNWFNTSVMPLLINGNIFNFKMIAYLSFIDFIDITKIAIFSDFDRDWYAILGPYYITFFIILCVIPFGSLVGFIVKYCGINWWVKRKCQSNNDKTNHPVIQKQANSLIAFVILNFPQINAGVCLYLLMCLMYSSLIPMLVPLFTICVFITYFINKFVLLRLSIKIPANEDLTRYIINILPFMILLHCIFGLWARTSPGIFSNSAYVYQLNYQLNTSVDITRIQKDIIMLGMTAIILIWIIFDFTLIKIFNVLRDCCKDELQMPIKFAAIENSQYSDRIKKKNIHGSYKLINHPIFGHGMKAYKNLIHKKNTKGDQSSLAFQ